MTLTATKLGKLIDAHLGIYFDSDGDLCVYDDEGEVSYKSPDTLLCAINEEGGVNLSEDDQRLIRDALLALGSAEATQLAERMERERLLA